MFLGFAGSCDPSVLGTLCVGHAFMTSCGPNPICMNWCRMCHRSHGCAITFLARLRYSRTAASSSRCDDHRLQPHAPMRRLLVHSASCFCVRAGGYVGSSSPSHGVWILRQFHSHGPQNIGRGSRQALLHRERVQQVLHQIQVHVDRRLLFLAACPLHLAGWALVVMTLLVFRSVCRRSFCCLSLLL